MMIVCACAREQAHSTIRRCTLIGACHYNVQLAVQQCVCQSPLDSTQPDQASCVFVPDHQSHTTVYHHTRRLVRSHTYHAPTPSMLSPLFLFRPHTASFPLPPWHACSLPCPYPQPTIHLILFPSIR
jgi:hypothetical protein